MVVRNDPSETHKPRILRVLDHRVLLREVPSENEKAVEELEVRKVLCADCNCELDWNTEMVAIEARPPCDDCGSVQRRLHVGGSAKLTVRGGGTLRAYRGGMSKSKGLTVTEMDIPGVHRATGENVRVYRRFDKVNDLYHERITVEETGAVIHECKEPLSTHTGHGSDKPSKQER